MLRVGLTGGIGAGKSTVAELLVAKGAVLVDADRIARQVVAPGGPAYQPMIDRFGPGIVGPDGQLDRQAIARVAFATPEALADLNAITHPAIGAAMAARVEEHAGTGEIVVLDIPLLKQEHRETQSLDAVVVVDTPTDVALDRLVTLRGMAKEDAEARIASQIDRAARLSVADLVVDNSQGREHLEAEVDRVWDALVARRAASDRSQPPPS